MMKGLGVWKRCPWRRWKWSTSNQRKRGSVELEYERYVQFIFEDKMNEFRVDWTLEDLSKAVTGVMKDDGYLWMPRDEERGTGAFVNLNNCTNIKIVERAVAPSLPPMPVRYDEPDEVASRNIEAEARSYLDGLEADGLPMHDTFMSKAPTKFLTKMLSDSLGVDSERALKLLESWRSTE